MAQIFYCKLILGCEIELEILCDLFQQEELQAGSRGQHCNTLEKHMMRFGSSHLCSEEVNKLIENPLNMFQ